MTTTGYVWWLITRPGLTIAAIAAITTAPMWWPATLTI